MTIRVRAVGRLAALAAAGAGAVVEAQTISVDAANRSLTPRMVELPVHVGGRVRAVPLAGAAVPAGATGFVHQWPGVYFEAAFRGDRVLLKFDDPANEYRLWIDSRRPIPLPQPGRVEVRISGLGPGAHRLRLEKVTESIDRAGAFQGFYIPPGEHALRVAPRARQIEFIGPSGMTGYGNRSNRTACTKEEVRLTTDTQRAYPALVAKHFGADYQVNAISGRGLVRNYGGSLPDSPLPSVYPYTFLDSRVAWQDPDWRPQIYQLSIGVDFMVPVGPGERFASMGAVAEAYLAGFRAFVGELHRRSPEAAILVEWVDSRRIPDARLRAEVERLERAMAEAAREVGVARFELLIIPELPLANSGCDYHPGLADHRLIAQWETGWLAAHPGLWRGRPAPPAPGRGESDASLALSIGKAVMEKAADSGD